MSLIPAILSPARGANADSLSEKVAEVRLVREAAGQCYLAKRDIGSQHEMRRPLDAAANDVGMRRLSEGALERPGKVRRTKTRDVA